jgi:RNA polymerase sigma factor (TIGR02999 family)
MFGWRAIIFARCNQLNYEAGEPMTPQTHEVTQLLIAWTDGDQTALAKLTDLVHEELYRLAKRYMGREAPGHTLQTTALVNEAYLRLIDANNIQWQNRAHFFAISANLMRRILVDYARSRNYLKRGGKALQVSLGDADLFSVEQPPDLLALDDALKTLAEMDARKSQIIELRFFGGLSVEETAEVLGVSRDTVLRDWRLSKSWLLRELSRKESDEA